GVKAREEHSTLGRIVALIRQLFSSLFLYCSPLQFKSLKRLPFTSMRKSRHYIFYQKYGRFAFQHRYDERYELNQAVITTNSRVTLKEFYKYQIHPRDGLPNAIFRMSKLFQENIVSAWMKIKKNNLQFLRTHQNQLRILDYQRVLERIRQPDFNRNEPIGRAFILPSSFEGSDQSMKQHYYDALEIAGHFGRADYFVTFASNPQWPELKRTLANGQ
ncbi:ATP-dependent Helicase, partial [Brachionus plicatilis]